MDSVQKIDQFTPKNFCPRNAIKYSWIQLAFCEARPTSHVCRLSYVLFYELREGLRLRPAFLSPRFGPTGGILWTRQWVEGFIKWWECFSLLEWLLLLTKSSDTLYYFLACQKRKVKKNASIRFAISVCPHATIRDSLNRFLFNLIMRNVIEIFRHIYLKIGKLLEDVHGPNSTFTCYIFITN